jgi:XRE family transcriptional regulator, regulator of sulfur utilization
MKLGDRLREIRQRQGETLLQVARSTDLSVSHLSDLERGKANPSIETLEKLATHYKLDLAGIVASVDGWGTFTPESLPAGLAELVQDGEIPFADALDLSRIELRGQRPKVREDWLALYYQLKSILRHTTLLSDGSSHVE